MPDDADADLRSVQGNRCPDCGNHGFIGGPRGGAGQNIYCANPECRAAFMVAPRGSILLVQRVGQAPECYYPPKVHILRGGATFCGFEGYRWIDDGPPPMLAPMQPVEWPVGHSWVGREDIHLCTCPQCRSKAVN